MRGFGEGQELRSQRPHRLQLRSLAAFFEARSEGYTRGEGDMGIEFTYGELTPEAVAVLLCDAKARLRKTPERSIQNFLDLGSGTGKIVLIAAALFPELKRAVGVELSRTRHGIAIRSRDELHNLAPQLALLDRVWLMDDDVRHAVAAIAVADVIWVSNTCFPNDLNRDIRSLIDDYAREGTLVYSTIDLKLGRVSQPSAVVHMTCSWAANHTANVARLIEPLPASDIEEQPTARAFSRWASLPHDRTGSCAKREVFPQLQRNRNANPMTTRPRQHPAYDHDHVLERGSFDEIEESVRVDVSQRVLYENVLNAAVSAALLPLLKADLLMDELVLPEGNLYRICSEAKVEHPDGFDFDGFAEVCRRCLRAARGSCSLDGLLGICGF